MCISDPFTLKVVQCTYPGVEKLNLAKNNNNKFGGDNRIISHQIPRVRRSPRILNGEKNLPLRMRGERRTRNISCVKLFSWLLQTYYHALVLINCHAFTNSLASGAVASYLYMTVR